MGGAYRPQPLPRYVTVYLCLWANQIPSCVVTSRDLLQISARCSSSSWFTSSPRRSSRPGLRYFMTATAAPHRAWRTGEEAPRRTGEEGPRRTGKEAPRRTGREAPRRTGEASRRTGEEAALRRTGKEAPRRTGKESPRRGEEAPRRTGEEAPRRVGKEAPRRTGETGGASLEESRSFGLSSRSLGGNVSVFQVKLTDSAARAIRSFQDLQACSSQPTISFNGSKGRIMVPCSENNELRIFTFGVTNIAHNNPHGSFDCFHQRGSAHLSTGSAPSGSAHLSCVGSVQRKLTVNATDDSYVTARQSLAAAEEETRRHAAIAIKHGGRFQGKKVTVRVPAPAPAGLSRPRPSSRSALGSVRRGGVQVGGAKPKAGAANRKCAADVQQLPLRQRVSHLLALRSYQRPELLLRLQRDGLTDQDRDQLDRVLMEVGQPGRNNTFTLKEEVYQELQKNWPGYTSGDQQLLRRVFVRKLFRPQQDHLRVPEAQVSPLRETPTSSPRRVQDYTDPLASKKPRISLCRPRPGPGPGPGPDRTTKGSLDPRQLFESLAAVCQQEPTSCQLEPTSCPQLEPTSCLQQEPTSCPQQEPTSCPQLEPTSCPQLEPTSCPQQEPTSCPTSCPQQEPTSCPTSCPQQELTSCPEQEPTSCPTSCPQLEPTSCPTSCPQQETDATELPSSPLTHRDGPPSTRRKRSKHREEEITDLKSSDQSSDLHGVLHDTSEMFDSEFKVETDFLLKYSVICSPDQRLRYKQDFNTEYSEYRNLHARIDGVTRQFMELDAKLRRLHHQSHKHKQVRNQILLEYRKIKKSNPNYSQNRSRCEYLHNKLSHIKRLISQYDQQQQL